MILKGYIFSILYAFICLGLGFAIYKIPGSNKKITRKSVFLVIFIMWTEGTQIKPPLIGARIEKAEAVRKNKIIPVV